MNELTILEKERIQFRRNYERYDPQTASHMCNGYTNKFSGEEYKNKYKDLCDHTEHNILEVLPMPYNDNDYMWFVLDICALGHRGALNKHRNIQTWQIVVRISECKTIKGARSGFERETIKWVLKCLGIPH